MNDIEKFINNINDKNSIQLTFSNDINCYSKKVYRYDDIKYVFNYEIIVDMIFIFYENKVPFYMVHKDDILCFDGYKLYNYSINIDLSSISKDTLEYLNILFSI